MSDDFIIESIDLDNGERLDIIDKSRMIARDTCLVMLIFRIKIEIKKKLIEKIPKFTEDNLRETLGEYVIYEATHERNFINDNKKEQVIKEVRDSFLNTNMKYLSHPDFSHKYVIKKYNEKKKNR